MNVIAICAAFAAAAAAQPGMLVRPVSSLNTAAWITKVTMTITTYSETWRAWSVLSQPKVHVLLSQKWSASDGGYAKRKEMSLPKRCPSSQFRPLNTTMTRTPTTT